MDLVFEPEAFDSAQQDAGLHLMAAVEVQQLVGYEVMLGSVTFAEVGRELEAILVHECAPIVRPSATAAIPNARLMSVLASARRNSPSSRNR